MNSIKKHFLFIFYFILIILPFYANSQIIRNIGIKSGLVVANQKWHYLISYIQDLDTKPRSGLDIGLSLEWLDISGFSVLTEMHYLQKGMKLTLPVRTIEFPSGTGQFVDLRPRVDYISFPILAQFKFPLNQISLYFLAGPRFDLLIYSFGDGADVVLDKFNKSEFGLTVGVGIVLPKFTPFKIGMEFRYSPSLQNSYSTQNLIVTNSSMEFLMSILF